MIKLQICSTQQLETEKHCWPISVSEQPKIKKVIDKTLKQNLYASPILNTRTLLRSPLGRAVIKSYMLELAHVATI